MNKVVLIIKEMSDNYRKIEFFGNDKSENILNQNEIKPLLFQYDDSDFVIHNIPFSIFNPKIMKILPKNLTVQEAFGCDWSGFLTQFKFQDIQDNKINASNFNSTSFNYDVFPLAGFYGELDEILSDKKMSFGRGADFQQYIADFSSFYDFLSVQKFPNPTTLARKEILVDKFKQDSFVKFIFSLSGYEGFATCTSLATDDINLDELDIFESKSEIIIPFNMFKYIEKYKGFRELMIKDFYISTKRFIDLPTDISPIEKLIKIAELTERSDPLTKMYARYYYFIFVLKYIKTDMIFIDLKSKMLQLHESNTYKTNYFHKIVKK